MMAMLETFPSPGITHNSLKLGMTALPVKFLTNVAGVGEKLNGISKTALTLYRRNGMLGNISGGTDDLFDRRALLASEVVASAFSCLTQMLDSQSIG